MSILTIKKLLEACQISCELCACIFITIELITKN